MPTTTLTTIATFEMKGFCKNHKTVFHIEIWRLIRFRTSDRVHFRIN